MAGEPIPADDVEKLACDHFADWLTDEQALALIEFLPRPHMDGTIEDVARSADWTIAEVLWVSLNEALFQRGVAGDESGPRRLRSVDA